MNKPMQPETCQIFNTLPSRCRILHHDQNNPRASTDRRIRAFLSGASHGADVLHALYGKIADEPVPERLRTVLCR